MSGRTIVYDEDLEGSHREAVVLAKTDPDIALADLGVLLQHCADLYPNAPNTAKANRARLLRDMGMTSVRIAVREANKGAPLDDPSVSGPFSTAEEQFLLSGELLDLLVGSYLHPGQRGDFRHIRAEKGATVLGDGRRLVARAVFQDPMAGYLTLNEACERFMEASGTLSAGDNANYDASNLMHYARARVLMGLPVDSAVREALWTLVWPKFRTGHLAALRTIGRLSRTLGDQQTAIDSVKNGEI